MMLLLFGILSSSHEMKIRGNPQSCRPQFEEHPGHAANQIAEHQVGYKWPLPKLATLGTHTITGPR